MQSLDSPLMLGKCWGSLQMFRFFFTIYKIYDNLLLLINCAFVWCFSIDIIFKFFLIKWSVTPLVNALILPLEQQTLSRSVKNHRTINWIGQWIRSAIESCCYTCRHLLFSIYKNLQDTITWKKTTDNCSQRTISIKITTNINKD